MKTMYTAGALSVIAALVLCACAPEAKPYDDIRQVLGKMHDVYVSYSVKLGKVASAKDAADTLNGFYVDFKDASKNLKSLSEKYPQLNTPEPPAELKELVDKLQEASTTFFNAMNVINTWGDDPLVLDALSKMSEVE